MSNSIGILRPGQAVSSKPSRHTTYQIASHLIARKVAFWIIQDKLLGMSDICQFAICMSLAVGELSTAPYIPEKMPPREVNGTWFQHPQSETWRREHRTVTFMPRTGEQPTIP